MGYIRHHSIVVIDWKSERLILCRNKSIELGLPTSEIGLPTSEIVKGACNGQESFAVLPDGSKEGWPNSDLMNVARDELVKYLNEQETDWVELIFGDGSAGITRSAR